MNAPVKESVNSKNTQTQNIQGTRDTTIRPNLRRIGIEEGEEILSKGRENIFNKTINRNFTNIKKKVPIKVEETYRKPNRLDQKGNVL